MGLMDTKLYMKERIKQRCIWQKQLKKQGLFEIVNDGSQLPIVCYKLREDINCDWDLYDLADRLLMKGWQVPAYPLPKKP